MAKEPLPVTAVDEAVAAVTRSFPATEGALALEVRRGAGPERYPLEWHLPWWLGTSYGLAHEVRLRLVIANVLGLCGLRLADDLADGEVAPADGEAAEEASTRLAQAALSTYRELFPVPTDPIWALIDTLLARTAAARAPRARDLLGRAAPAKIGAHAVLSLTGRNKDAGLVDDCLDNCLMATVLFDHFVDWPSDIEAGRWNAFVDVSLADVKTDRSTPTAVDMHRVLLNADLISSYTATISRQMTQAVVASRALGVDELEHYLRELSEAMESHSEELRTLYRDLARQATGLFEAH